ncbi:NTP transferase domain-containing protein [Paenibacillus sp. HJGM_3]|uniref:NTP transferase domain-containing protein n=1 Tax=Paenibacillus sp. HJGM_3 TaxID=3379816 RepID=UPI00385B5E2D
MGWISTNSVIRQRYICTVALQKATSEPLRSSGLALRRGGAMILLADQPLITAEMLNQLLDRFNAGLESDEGLRYVASASGNVLSPPMLFSREAFPDLLRLKGDSGAKPILHGMTGITVEHQEAALLCDIDCRAEYEAYVCFKD